MISPLNKGASQSGGAAPAQNQAVALRVAVIGAVLLALFAVVFFRLWYLQVLSGDSLAAAAVQNRTRKVAITAPRGEIKDRNGKTMVSSRRAQSIELEPGSLPMIERTTANAYGQALQKWNDQLVDAYTRDRVAAWKRIPEKVLTRFPRPRYPSLDDPKLLREYAESEKPGDLADLRGRYQRLGELLEESSETIRRRVINSLYLLPYANVRLTKKDVRPEVAEYVAENAEMFPGVSSNLKYVRSYPLHEVGAQLFGQVGPVPTEGGKSIIDKYKDLDTAELVGVNGLELQYDGYLRGRNGVLQANIDAFGNVKGEPKRYEPTPGNDLQLTLDKGLQETAQAALAAGSAYNPGGNPGGAVAMDPRNGEVLAAVSNPSFDPNELVRGISDEEFAKFTDPNGSKPLFNRVTDAAYPAASTFKAVTSFAALSSGVTTVGAPVNDTGAIKISDTEFQNAKRTAFGPVALTRAITVSSDVYFYVQGARMNTIEGQPLQTWARQMGYGRKTGIDLPGENGGTIPDRKWREDRNDDERDCRKSKDIPMGVDVYEAGRRGCGLSDLRSWSIGDQVNLSVGQGDVQVTPLQTAVAYSAIENGGKVVRPHLAKALQNRPGETIQEFQFPSKRKIDFDPIGLQAVQTGLYDAANGEGGTSTGVFADWPRDKYPVHGKTGTAERTGQPDQSWYVAYVPHPTRPIVVVVTVEDGGFGAEKAAPIAALMMKKWFRINAKVQSDATSSAN